MKDLNFRKTALTKVGSFVPAKSTCVAGVGVTGSKPIKVQKGI